MTKNEVMEKLKEVIDFEVGLDIVELGLIYRVDVGDDGRVEIDMTVTAPGCPLQAMFPRLVREKVMELGAKDVVVNMVFDPPWSPEMMSEEAKKKLGMI